MKEQSIKIVIGRRRAGRGDHTYKLVSEYKKANPDKKVIILGDTPEPDNTNPADEGFNIDKWVAHQMGKCSPYCNYCYNYCK